MSRTQQERKAETRARLLAAAADLFAEQGIDAVSVDAVAEAAGRTSGAVYAHFGSKQGLLLALLDSWKDSVLTVLLAEVAVSDSPAGQLAAVCAEPTVSPEDLAVLLKALLTGLALQKRLEPDSVRDDLALRGIAALVGLPGALDRPYPDPTTTTASD